MSLLARLFTALSPQALVKLSFQLWPNRDYLICGGQRLTRRQTGQQIIHLASGLHALGVQRGDRVATLLPACPEAICALFLTNYLGTLHVPLNPLLGEQDLHGILAHAQANVVITAANWYGLQQAAVLQRLRPRLPELRHIIVVGDSEPLQAPLVSYQEVLDQGSRCGTLPRVQLKAKDPVLLSYTSGATGQPKGVLHTYAGYWGIIGSHTGRRMDQHALECLLLPFPPYHYAGLFGVTAALFAGGKIILMDRLDPEQMLAYIEDEKVTQIGGSATMYRLLLNALRRAPRNVSSVRRLTFSAEKLSREIAFELHEHFQCSLDNFYGTTESMLITWTDIGDSWETATESVGRPAPGVEIKVVDEARQPVLAGLVGEIAVRSSQIMAGYYRNPALSAQCLDAAGWFYTGDAGYLDAQGYLHLTDRLKDIIIRAGEKIYPQEVETFLENHPKIRRAALVGLPHPLFGEEVAAFLETAPGVGIDLEEVRSFCQGQIAAYKIPTRVYSIPQMPLTHTGKIQKFRLRSLLAAQAGDS